MCRSVAVAEKSERRLARTARAPKHWYRERIDAQTKLLMFSILGALLTTAAIVLGAVGLGA